MFMATTPLFPDKGDAARQNTNTGRLTPKMSDAVIAKIRAELD
jgi:hypothetical protein